MMRVFRTMEVEMSICNRVRYLVGRLVEQQLSKCIASCFQNTIIANVMTLKDWVFFY